MRNQMIRALWVLGLSGCTGMVTYPGRFDEPEPAAVVLEGSDLENELTTSPRREASSPFQRLGAIWDADIGARVEVMTSVDGVAWSPWAELVVVDVQVEAATSFVGYHEVVGEPASYYRLRAIGDELPTFLNLELLAAGFSDFIEDGTDPEGDGTGSTTQALTVGDAAVNSRASWGARAPRCVSYHTPNRFTVHHTATPTVDSLSVEARLRQIQAYHQDVRGWCDIGYQYLVSRDGRLWEGRGAKQLGAHVANNNSGNIGISFIGTYDSTQITDGQLTAAASLVRGLADQYGIAVSASTVKGHRDYGGSDCPGDALYGQLGALRDLASGAAPEPEPEPEPEPDPDTTTVVGVVYIGADTSKRIVGATVTLGSRTATTDAVGYFELAGVPAGTVTVSAAKAGYDAGSVTRATTGAETWASVGLWPTTATGTAKLQGVVYHGTNSLDRIPDATIALSNGRTTTADDNGYYLIEGLAPGTYTITASASGMSKSISRTVANGTTTWGSVRLY